MKILCIVTLSLLMACADRQKTNVAEPDNQVTEVTTSTSHKVKRKITTDYNYKPGDKCVGGVTIYNKQGQMKEEYDYSSCETLFKKVLYAYDETGKISISTIKSNLENVTYNWIYNDQGQVTEILASQPTNSFQYKLVYTYDSLGNQVEYRGTMADGSAFHGTSRKEYSYENGNKVKTVCYSGDNFDILGYRIEHLYGAEGKEIMNYIYKNPQTDKADTVYVFYEYH